jgi:hypothetical protein
MATTPDCATFRICSAARAWVRRATRSSSRDASVRFFRTSRPTGAASSKKPRGSESTRRGSGWLRPSSKARKQNLSRVFDILEEVGTAGQFAEAAGVEGQALRGIAHRNGGASARAVSGPVPDAGARGGEAGSGSESGAGAFQTISAQVQEQEKEYTATQESCYRIEAR